MKKTALACLLCCLLALSACAQPPADSLARQLYAAQVQYTGDDSQISSLLNVVLSDKLGLYTIQLQTAEEPYSLTILFESGQPENELMTKYAWLILALVDNLTEVNWSNGVNNTLGTDLTAAQDLLGVDNIKDYAASPEQVQALLDALEL